MSKTCCLGGYVDGDLEKLKDLSRKLSVLIEVLGSCIVSIYLESRYDGCITKIFLTRERAKKNFKIYYKSYSRGIGWESEVEKIPLTEWGKTLEEINRNWLQGFLEGEIIRWQICFRTH